MTAIQKGNKSNKQKQNTHTKIKQKTKRMKAKRNKVTNQVSTMSVIQSSPFTSVNNHE